MSCTPSLLESKECGFASFEKKFFDLDKTEWIKGMIKNKTPFFEIRKDPEFLDFLNEFPVIELKKGTVLCYSDLSISRLEKGGKFNKNVALWWNKYFPLTKKFSFETDYGNEKSYLNLFYELKHDISLLFIPPVFRDRYNSIDREYFSEETIERKQLNEIAREETDNLRSLYLRLLRDKVISANFLEENNSMLESLKFVFPQLAEHIFKIQNRDIYEIFTTRRDIGNLLEMVKRENIDRENTTTLYSGARLVQGVKGWEKKGYKIIKPGLLGDRLSKLGFNGYVSCDGCEVFLSPEIMKKAISRPFYAELNPQIKKEEIKEMIRKYNENFYEPIEMSFDFTPTSEIVDIDAVLNSRDFSLF